MPIITCSDKRVQELLNMLGQPPMCAGAKIIFEPGQAVKIVWECYLGSDHAQSLKRITELEPTSEVVPVTCFGGRG